MSMDLKIDLNVFKAGIEAIFISELWAMLSCYSKSLVTCPSSKRPVIVDHRTSAARLRAFMWSANVHMECESSWWRIRLRFACVPHIEQF